MLEVVNLQKTFTSGVIKKRAVRAVDGVSFRIEDGKTFGIVGNSGCGKSTIARMLLSLIRPDGGEIYIDGEDIQTAEPQARRRLTRKIQMIFQHPESSLDPSKRIRYSLMEPMRIHGVCGSRDEQEARMLELMRLVDLGSELLNRYPHQISGGEAQRVMIARALTLEPKLLILDEPTSMLDVSIQAQVMNIFRDLQGELNLSYLFISHDIDVVRWLCDEIAVMNEGRFVEHGPTDSVIENSQHPFTQELLKNFSFDQDEQNALA